MMQLILSLVLLFGFQSCSASTSPVLNDAALRPFSGDNKYESPRASLAGVSSDGSFSDSPLATPSFNSINENFNQLVEEERSAQAFNSINENFNQLVAEERSARALFEKILFVLFKKEQAQMSQEFVQVMELLQDERVARALFEKICLVELRKEFKQFKQQVQLERKINKCICREVDSFKRLLRKQKQEFECLVQREKCIKQEICSREDLLQREELALHLLKQKALYLFGVASIKSERDFINCPVELSPQVHPEFKNRLVVRLFKLLGKLCLV